MKTGTTVRLRPPPPVQGVVRERRINTASDEIECLVEWTEHGQPVRRWFAINELEEVQP